MASAAVVTVLVSGTPPTREPAADPATVEVLAGNAARTPEVLGEIATAAAAASVPVPQADQYVYVRSLSASIDATPAYEGTGPAVFEGLQDREVWLSQEPDGGIGLIREDGVDTRLNLELGGGGDPARYEVLAQLPTDPQQLLDQVRATASDDLAAFLAIGSLLQESLAPPAVDAALYRAVALIPGVEVVPGAQDAAGRAGIGVALVRNGQRHEWIFDAGTHSYLGAREYLVADGPMGPAGTLTGLTAVLARGVADSAGTVPDAEDLVG
ncbi:hypothetical protein GCM10023162_20310 [Klenkia terrae]